MKYLWVITLLLLSANVEAQEVKFDKNNNFKVGDNVSFTPKHLDPSNTGIEIKTDIGIHSVTVVPSDKKVLLGKLISDGIYNIQVSFDTLLTRDYQGLVFTGTNEKQTFKERVPFGIDNIDSAKKVLKLLLDSIRTDTLFSSKIKVKSSCLLSFKLYKDANEKTTMVTGFYCTSGDCSQLRQYLKDFNDKLFKTAKPDYYDLFNAVFNGPSLIVPAVDIDFTKFSQFTIGQLKSKTKLQIYTKNNSDEYSFILNLP